MAGVADATTEDAHMREASAGDGVAHPISTSGIGSAVEISIKGILPRNRIKHDIVSAAGNIVDGVAHRGQGAATEDVVVDDTAGDLDIGIAEDTASGEAVGVVHKVGLIDTAATAIDIAGVDDGTHALVGLILLSIGEVGTNLAVLNLDGSVPPDVAVFGAAEDGAVDTGVPANFDVGIAHIVVVGEGILEVVIGRIDGGIDCTGASVAVTGAIDVAGGVIVGGMVVGIGSDVAARDGDMGGAFRHGVATTRGRTEGTHRGQLTATVDVLLHTTVGDGDIAVATDIGGDGVTDIALTGTIEVTVDNTAGFLKDDGGGLSMGVITNFCQLATAIDVALDPSSMRGDIVADNHLRVGDTTALRSVVA